MARLVPLLVLLLLLLLVNTIEIVDNEGKMTAICLPPTIETTETALKAYTKYLSSLTVFYIPSTFSPADIPFLKERYQIPASARIRALGPKERACYYRPGEVCFYESAFEHGLKFPMDDHLRELLASLDVAPGQVPPNMWSYLIGYVDLEGLNLILIVTII